MALQHYLKNTENYCVAAAPAAQAFTSTTAGVVIQQAPHLQLQYTTPVVRTTTAATATTPATQQQARQHSFQQLHHLTLHQQQQQQPQQVHHTTPNNTTTATQQGIRTTIVATTTPQSVITQPQQQLLIHSQQRLKQLQLKQPTIHQQHTTYHHHHPYYQQHTTNNNNSNNNNKNTNTNSVINTIVITGAANHKFKSAQHTHHQQLQLQQQQTNYSHNRTLPIHAALNQNSNFSAVSSSTGGGTASSHAPTQQSNATNSSRSSNGRTNAHNAADSAKQQGGAMGAQMRSSSAANSNSITTATNSKKIRTEPLLSQYHQTERLTFANSHLVWGEEHWRRVVFQDERKFNLDGPDGFSNYFHDLRNYEQTLSQRPRGNSVYIYILLTVGGPIHMEVSTAKQRSQTYIETILRERSNIITKLGGNPDFILQDHNLTANMTPNTQELLEAEGIKLQRWPTIAHDLNIMENIWGWLVREVYDGGRKFARKDDLIFRIRSAWTRLPMDFVVNLYSTLPERIAELYYTRGIYTNC